MGINDSEYKIMNILWSNNGVLKANEIASIAKDEIGWAKNTTYTLLSRLIKKGVIKREDPAYLCTALLKRDIVCKNETENIIKKHYKGSYPMLFKTFLIDKKFSPEDIRELKKIINEI